MCDPAGVSDASTRVPVGGDPAAVPDPDPLGRWMDAQGLPGDGTRPRVERLSGGSQNELFALERGGARYALRRPPLGASQDRIDTMLREFTVLRALRDTDVPHPRMVGGDEGDGVLGGPFYVTELVDGWSPMSHAGAWPSPFDTDLDARRGLAFALVDGIALLSKVDWRAKGLADLGRPEGFHERQVDRWTAFLERIKGRELPGFDVASAWLRAHEPLDFVPGIMHGDYQFANVMFRHGAPARLAAIIDWEMATVGDPLLDLGWVLIAWPPEGDDMQGMSYADLTGMPSRDEVLQHYAESSGRPVDDIDYYVILARFKLGIVLEASAARYHRGEADERVAAFGVTVLELIRKAAELARATP